MLQKHIIKNIKEPKVLYLMWQDLSSNDRNRYHIGNLYEDRFEYLKENFPSKFDGFPAFSPETEIHTGNVLSVFISRCPPKERITYNNFLEAYGLDPEQAEVKNISDFALLGYTGAYLPSDEFHLFNPFKDIEPPFQFVMKIAGAHRHCRMLKDLGWQPDDDELKIVPEPENKNDSQAISVTLQCTKLGYIPKGLTQSFHSWLDSKFKISLHLYRANGSEEHRFLYCFVNVSK
ncbi:MAG: HIRAN domain-containing protein [Candidatus Caenarcaniphilales bacterium]|nr:HIRAN domain-containing protein [Candidatus Caenarcaniphilales bacterium]